MNKASEQTSSDQSLWKETSDDVSDYVSLQEKITTDIVIVGGGFTGCSAAIAAAEKGMDVCLIEANTIGHGGSGRNVGLVNAGLWTPPDDVKAELGDEAGERLNKILADGPELVFSLIKKFDISCEAIRNGTLHCAHSPKGMKDLENRYGQQMARNAPVELLDQSRASKMTGASEIYGALLDKRAGTIQPLSYARGLGRTAKNLGVRMFEKTAATSIQYEGGAWQVKTASGHITAEKLIVAGNAYFEDKTSHTIIKAVPKFTPVHFFQCATPPLSEELRATILPDGQGCWDTAMIMTSFRLDQAGRLIIGSIGSLDHTGADMHLKWVKRKMAALYPQLAPIDFEFSWHGRIAMTDDHMPKVIDLGNGGVSIFGYNGRGISPGTVFGRAAVDFVLDGGAHPMPLMPLQKPEQTLGSVKAGYYEFGASLIHMLSLR